LAFDPTKCQLDGSSADVAQGLEHPENENVLRDIEIGLVKAAEGI
jgi:hypothetical protein